MLRDVLRAPTIDAQYREARMKLNKVTIKNFKAINEATIDLSLFTAIIGANGSGKSSILQALHWMFQSGRNLSVDTNKSPRAGSTLSEKNATYMSSPEYRNAGHGPEYGNFRETPQLDVEIDAQTSAGESVNASMWIKSARNEGLSVHVPSNNAFVAALRDRGKEFSSYIPGLAGIPLFEERRTKLIVHRQAAAGDANTVLRNVLLLLEGVSHKDITGLAWVQKFVSEVLGDLTLRVSFDEEKKSDHLRDISNCRYEGCRPEEGKAVGVGWNRIFAGHPDILLFGLF